MNSNSSGAFYIQSNQYFTASSVQMKYCQSNLTGGFYTLVNSSISDLNGQYSNAKASLGGAIYCLNCSVYLQNSSFAELEAEYGGFLYVENYGSFSLNNLTVQNSSATISGGAFAI